MKKLLVTIMIMTALLYAGDASEDVNTTTECDPLSKLLGVCK